MTAAHPLIVDLDGSLLRTDSLHESLAVALRKPQVLLLAVRQLLRNGKAGLKEYLAAAAPIDVGLLPVNDRVLEFVQFEHAKGRTIFLVTGANSHIANQIIQRFAEFEGRFSSDGHINLTSGRKAELLVQEFGAQGFDYIGNSPADTAVWREARHSYLATTALPTRPLPRWARDIAFEDVLREDSKSTWRIWLRELRVHQSLKNLLLFLPIIAAHTFDGLSLLLLTAGFVSFSLMASSVYLLNDLLDLKSDRLHPRKSLRPLAAGQILPMHALAASGCLAIIALVTAVMIGIGFTLVLVLYVVLTCLYSFWLKRVTLVDVTLLAMLYMIRILAGAVIAGIELSFWFTGMALFLFISLALVKRYTELSLQTSTVASERLPGRGYSRSDASVILPLGVGSGMAVLVLMAIYLQSSAVTLLYPSETALWLVIPAMFYWIANIWLQAGRGAMHDDPIVFALKNPPSLISGGIIALLFIAASTPIEGWAGDLMSTIGAQ